MITSVKKCLLRLLVQCLLCEHFKAVCTDLKESEIQEIVTSHNFYRSETEPAADNMRHMRWEESIATLAQTKANECVYSHGFGIFHPTLGKLGENIYITKGRLPNKDFGVSRAVMMWNNESVNYDYQSNLCKFGEECGHYTQVVWANSFLIGCGINYCSNTITLPNNTKITGATILLCFYSVAGNVQNGFLFRDRRARPFSHGAECSNCPREAPYCSQKLCSEDLYSTSTDATRQYNYSTQQNALIYTVTTSKGVSTTAKSFKTPLLLTSKHNAALSNRTISSFFPPKQYATSTVTDEMWQSETLVYTHNTSMLPAATTHSPKSETFSSPSFHLKCYICHYHNCSLPLSVTTQSCTTSTLKGASVHTRPVCKIVYSNTVLKQTCTNMKKCLLSKSRFESQSNKKVKCCSTSLCNNISNPLSEDFTSSTLQTPVDESLTTSSSSAVITNSLQVLTALTFSVYFSS